MGIMDLLLSGRSLDPGRQKPMAIPPGWLQGAGPDITSGDFGVPGFEGFPDLPPPPAMNGPPPYSSGLPPQPMNGPPPYSSGLPPELPNGPGQQYMTYGAEPAPPPMNGPPPYSSGATQPDTQGQLRMLLERMLNQPPQGEREKLRPNATLRDISMRTNDDPALTKWLTTQPQYRPLQGNEQRANPDGSYSTEITATDRQPGGGWRVRPSLWMGAEGPVELKGEQGRAAADSYEQQGYRFPRFPELNQSEAWATERSQQGGIGAGPLARPMGTAPQPLWTERRRGR